MRKIPTYDWDWFESHTPFKKILEETCELEIYKEVIPYNVIGYIWSNRNHYNIKLNYPMLQDNFEEIKRQILNTRVCKHNKEIFDWIDKLECSKKEICYVIIDGCIANVSRSFTWGWCDKEES